MREQRLKTYAIVNEIAWRRLTERLAAAWNCTEAEAAARIKYWRTTKRGNAYAYTVRRCEDAEGLDGETAPGKVGAL